MRSKTDRLVQRTVRISTRRPPEPRELAFDFLTNLFTWAAPKDSRMVTHYRIRIDSDSDAPLFQPPVGQTSIQLTPGITRIFLSSYNQVSDQESGLVMLDVAPSGAGDLTLSFAASQGQQGVAFSASCVATGGMLPYTFSHGLFGFPAGLSLDTTTGHVTGVPTTPGLYAPSFTVHDAAGNSAVVTGAINIAQPSGASPLIAVSTVTGLDLGHGIDEADPVNRLVSFYLGVTLTFATTPTQYCTIYRSEDGGSNWLWSNVFLWSVSGQGFSLRLLRPLLAATWKVAAVPGIIDGGTPNTLIPTASLPPGTVLSLGFTVDGLTAPSGTVNSSPTPATGAGGDFPYNQFTDLGDQFWLVPTLTIDSSYAATLANVFVLTTTFQDLDALGRAIGPEQVYNHAVVIDGQIMIGEIRGEYGTSGFGYDRAYPYPSGSPATLAAIRMREYASSRLNQDPDAFTDPATSTLDMSVGSGAGYIDIPIATGGASPPGKVLATRLHPDSLGHGPQLHPISGKLVLANDNLAASALMDPGFEFSIGGSVVDAAGVLGPGDLRQWVYGVPAGSSLEIKTNGGNSGNNYVRMMGPSTYVAQEISVQPGLPVYMAAYARSSNNGSVNHALNFVVTWYTRAGVSISASTITALTGYVAAFSLISGHLTAPATAATAIVKFQLGGSEPAGDYWDIDDVNAQSVVQQTGHSQESLMLPVVAGADYSALRALSTVDNSRSYYGRQTMFMNGPGGCIAQIQVGAAGFTSFTLADDSNANNFAMQVSNAGVALAMTIASVLYNGYTGTVQAAYAANKPVKNGFIMV